MKKRGLWLLALLALMSINIFNVQGVAADEKTPTDEFRVGMEAGYAPFNWTQSTDVNGAVQMYQSTSYAGGYDVQIAQKIADGLGKKLVIVKTKWDGLSPALQSGTIDAIIAGMSPTTERRKEIDFTDAYYESQLVMVVRQDGPFANAQSLADLNGAKITAQLNTFHYSVIDQIPGVQRETAMDSFSAMRAALTAGIIDGYVSERPEGVTATAVDSHFKMLEFTPENNFQTSPEDVQVAVGMRKGDSDVARVNEILATISSAERSALMDQAIQDQPADTTAAATNPSFFTQVKTIWQQYGNLFLRGAGLTLLVALVGTVAGMIIGLLVGVFRTLPQAHHALTRFLQKLMNILLSIYIEVFRGTPMMVQAMVIFYGVPILLGLQLDRTFAGLFIVSINTGAYMSEIVRGGIFAVDSGQFEAAQAIGMTHGQTMRKVVLPQVLRNILPATGNEFVINIKDTAVLSVIGFADLFFQGNSAAGSNFLFFQTFTIIGIIYLILTFTITTILRAVEKKMDGPSAYTQITDETTTDQEVA